MPPKSRAKGASGSSAKGAGSNPAAEDSWARDQAVSTLNDAKLAGDATQKCAHLKTLAELVVHKDAGLLDEFLEPLLEMRVDTNKDVRKTIAGLCEQIAKEHPARIAPCVEATRHLLGDESAAVAKAAAKGATALYKQAFVYVSNKGKGVGARKTVPKAVKDIWKAAKNLDEDLKAFALSEKANDGARMQAVRFLEKTLCFLCAVSSSLAPDHALLNPDDIATECDSLLGVLLECLKPDAMRTQSSPATLVMIAAAAGVAERCAQYCEFVVPALCELAEAVGKVKSDDETGKSAATASIGKELKSQLVALTKLDHAQMDEHRDAIDAALRESLDAAAEADAARTRRERVEARKREREDRGGSGSVNKRSRTSDDDRDDLDLDLERSGTPDASGDDGLPNASAQVTPKHLLAQVLTTVDALARTDRAVLEGFVSRLAPEVLADVVLASLENADVRLLGGRVAVDVAAGMGAGAEGFVEWAADTHARGGGETRGSVSALAATGTVENPEADFEKTELEPEPETEKSAVSGKRPAKPPAPFVFAPKIAALSKESRDAHAAAALARIVKAADPGGAVAAMGGATVQRALFARLAAAATAQTAAKSEASFSSFSAFSFRGAETRARAEPGGSLSVGVLASRPSDLSDETKQGGSSDLAGALLETLVAALPDPNAHAAVTRVLGATFVNETAVVLDANDTTSIAPAGAYSRALMTVVVGLLESDSSARLKHVAKVLVDAPAVPPAAILLLRALCRLPLGGAEDDPNSVPESAFVADADPNTSLGFTVSREETDASGGVVTEKSSEKKKVSSHHRRVVRWGGVPLPDSSDVVNAALASLLELVTRRPTARAKCLEIALEAATSADEDVRARAIRAVVGKLHPVETLAKAVEAYAEFHLGVAAGAGAAALADARRVAAEASAAMRRAAEKRAAAERAREAEAKRLKAEAEGFAAKPVAATATADDSAPAPADATTGPSSLKNPEGKSDDAENDDGVSKASAEAQETLRRVEAAAVASAVAAVSRHILLFCALCNRERALLPKVFRAFATLPEELRPALLDDAGAGVVTTGGFDGLVRLVGPECGPLLDAVRNPPKGSESLAARAIRVLADADAAEAEYLRDAAAAGGVVAGDAAKDHGTRASMDNLVSAAETLAARVRAEADARRTIPNDDSNATTNENASNDEESHEDVELLLPLLSAMSAEKVRSLVPRLVALPPELFKQALDRLCVSGSPLTPSELFVALHEVDPATRGVGLKKIIAACGECFERPDTFGAETLASAMSKMVEMHPLPLLFMRTVIQAESAWPTLREFTVNILRSLASKKVWKADAKIWEGFVRCAKRAAPRSFPVLIQMPEAPLLEILKKFPALVEPLRAYANAPAVAQSVPRAVRDALAKA